MSSIQAINNLNENQWQISASDLTYNYVDLYIGFSNGNPIVEFKDLSFGYKITAVDFTQEETYPQDNIVYISTDEQFLVVERILLQPNTFYELILTSTNDGIFSEGTFTFTTPELPTPPPGPTGATGA